MHTCARTRLHSHTNIGRQPSRLDKECLRKLYEFHKQLKAYIAAEEVKLERRHSHAVSFCCVCVYHSDAASALQIAACLCVCARIFVRTRISRGRALSIRLSRSLARSLFMSLTLSTWTPGAGGVKDCHELAQHRGGRGAGTKECAFRTTAGGPYVCICVCMHVCMHVCVYINSQTHLYLGHECKCETYVKCEMYETYVGCEAYATMSNVQCMKRTKRMNMSNVKKMNMSNVNRMQRMCNVKRVSNVKRTQRFSNVNLCRM